MTQTKSNEDKQQKDERPRRHIANFKTQQKTTWPREQVFKEEYEERARFKPSLKKSHAVGRIVTLMGPQLAAGAKDMFLIC